MRNTTVNVHELAARVRILEDIYDVGGKQDRMLDRIRALEEAVKHIGCKHEFVRIEGRQTDGFGLRYYLLCDKCGKDIEGCGPFIVLANAVFEQSKHNMNSLRKNGEEHTRLY